MLDLGRQRTPPFYMPIGGITSVLACLGPGLGGRPGRGRYAAHWHTTRRCSQPAEIKHQVWGAAWPHRDTASALESERTSAHQLGGGCDSDGGDA